MHKSMAMILAGGKGTRLLPLTEYRCKPAIPFGGHYRIIDFTLSNCINSNIRKIAVLTQYKSYMLERHLRLAWNVMESELGEFIIPASPRIGTNENWYRGTADAVYQNLHLVQQENADSLLVLSGDHVYKMDYSGMKAFHHDVKADATVGVIEIACSVASRFGIIEMDPHHQITRFVEKPQGLPSGVSESYEARTCYANMGIYLFNIDLLAHFLTQDAHDQTDHDFGKNIIPKMVKEARVMGFEFRDENRKQVHYWRDIGTLDSYWEANMDLVSVDPLFNLYDDHWPVRTFHGQYPPAKYVFANEYKDGRIGMALNSIVCNGCIISGAHIERSLLSPNARVNDYSEVSDSVIMEDVVIGQNCRIRKAIIDAGTHVPPKTTIGYDNNSDREQFVVTDSGIVAVSKKNFPHQ